MRTTVSFLELLQEAVQLVLRSRLLLAFALPFGLLAWGGAWVSERLTSLLPESPDTLGALWPIIDQSGSMLIAWLSLIFGFGILRALCRGPFFLLAEARFVREKNLEQPSSPAKKTLLRGAFATLLFELAYWGALALLSLVILIPILLALRYNQGAATTIAELGLILLMVLSIALFYLKEFGLLYRLLAHIRPLLALELGLKLFKKHLFWSILFGLFLMGLSLLFTFLVNLAIIASDFITTDTLRHAAAGIATIAIFGISAIIEEVLRLLFFHALAAAPKQPALGVKKLLEEKSPGNVPSV